jgi:hypothetical protein
MSDRIRVGLIVLTILLLAYALSGVQVQWEVPHHLIRLGEGRHALV